MNISELLIEKKNPNDFLSRQYVQLASGVSMECLGFERRGEWLILKLQRYNRDRDGVDITEHSVREDGSYLPNKELCTCDIISVTDTTKCFHMTEIGYAHTVMNVNLLNSLKLNQQNIIRIRTRAGYWYTVLDVLIDNTREILMLKLAQVGSQCKIKMKHYHNNGTEYSEKEYPTPFSIYDIVEVQVA